MQLVGTTVANNALIIGFIVFFASYFNCATAAPATLEAGSTEQITTAQQTTALRDNAVPTTTESGLHPATVNAPGLFSTTISDVVTSAKDTTDEPIAVASTASNTALSTTSQLAAETQLRVPPTTHLLEQQQIG
uniref:Uncharacterized protein n=1 Tax=Macrostomum lignano TaxID=282301 RepID=A0A1I8JHW2_9PLAT